MGSAVTITPDTKPAPAITITPDSEEKPTFGEGMAHASLFRNVSEQLGKLADWAEGKASKADIENLKKVAGGERGNEMEAYSPRAGYDLLARVTKLLSGATEPKSVLTTAGVALANTNPVTGIPVDAALVAHGGMGVAKNAKAALGGDPEAAERALLSGAEAVGGAAGVGTQAKAITSGSFASRLYQSALKPSTTLTPEARARVIQTGLKEGVPVSAGGVEKIATLVDDLNTKIQAKIDAGSAAGKTVNKMDVANRLGDVGKRFSNQVNPEADLAAIQASGEEFMRNQPADIPASDAQALKKGTYQQLKSKAYGELKNASIESQKALARGLKEELVAQFPEIADLNARESNLIGLDKQLERAVGRIENHQMLGIGTPLAAAGGKAVTGSTGVAAAVGILKAIFDDPFIKSKLAISLNKGSKGAIPLNQAAQRVGLYGAALGAAASTAPRARQEGEQPNE